MWVSNRNEYHKKIKCSHIISHININIHTKYLEKVTFNLEKNEKKYSFFLFYLIIPKYSL